ncbi:arabinofuranosyltransferase [Risungbinella massiliensis]|uniref:arabinofuranosyltransferase n=1 Tax=Risungbinella massiliensis TaxID=1329796 RepID=UPI0005CC3E2B|nr:arabinofuranosyltransferase [Risungbinella massiliensis]
MNRKQIYVPFIIYLLFTVAISMTILRFPVGSSKLMNLLIPQTALLFLAFVLLVVFYITKNELTIGAQASWICIFILGFFISFFTVFMYRNTYFGFGGIEDDLEFITASITKYKVYWSWVDFSYQDLSAFYPPLYFYILGKIAWLLDIEAYKMVRYGLFLEALLLTPFLYFIWSKLKGHTFALLLTFWTVLFFPHAFHMKPYEFITMTCILPWWFSYVEPQNKYEKIGKQHIYFLLIGGVLGALLFQTYYYWFFLLFVYLFLQICHHVWKNKSFRAVWQTYRQTFQVLILMFLASSYFLIPLLSNFVSYGVLPQQNRYLTYSMLKIPTFTNMDFQNVILLIGLGSLIYFSRKNEWMRKILLLVISCYLWELLSLIGILIDKPLLHFKMFVFLEYLLLIGFSYLLYHITTLPGLRGKNNILIGSLLVMAFLTLGQHTIKITESFDYHQTNVASKPTEVAVLERHDVQGKVILTDNNKLQMFVPIFDFVSREYAFSHHSGQRGERIQFLRELAKSQNPEFIAWMLRYNRFSAVDYVWLYQNQLTLMVDAFPKPEFPSTQIIFQPNAFQGPYFAKVEADQNLIKIQPVPKEIWHHFSPEEKKLVKKYQKTAD